MKIKFLGSAAYDGIPAPFCGCDTCRKSKEAGGRNLRTRTQALVNDDLLIDYNNDTVSHLMNHVADSQTIEYCLITHNHSDHLCVNDILIPQYSTVSSTVHYYAAERGYRDIQEGLLATPEAQRFVKLSKIEPMKSFACGQYKVLPIPANHDPDSSPVFFAIGQGGKRLLYAHDTGVFSDEAIDAVVKFGRFDLVSLDCTGALQKGWRNGHMCLETDLEVFDGLKNRGALDDRTVKVINHFSHNGNATHDELTAVAEKYNITVGYDGLLIEF